MDDCVTGDLLRRDAVDIIATVASGALSAAELMQATLARIAAVNPAVNALVSLRSADDLMAEAQAADAAPRSGALAGLPMAVKDLVATAGIRTTWGSPLFADHVPDRDDLLAARLRAAGAILIGKSNVPEYGLGSHSFNPVFGVTRNPYDLGLSAGGSSGGAAAALATGMVALADGSDMMGSLRNPAAFCNVYGFRPTWDLVPAEPYGDTFLHVMSTEGPMARSPRDLALLLGVIAGPDLRLPHSRPVEDYRPQPGQSLKGKRIGWLGNWGNDYPVQPGILPLCEAALQTMVGLGATVEAVKPPFPAAKLWESWTMLRSWAVAMSKRDPYRDPAKRAQMKPELIWEVERGLALSAEAVHDASMIRSDWYATLAKLFTRFDALALPSAQVWPFPADWRYPAAINGRRMDTYHRWMEVVVPVALAGVPALAVPAGFGDAGLPMGMQLFAAAGQDRALLQWGQSYHEATNWPGKFPPQL